MSAEQNQWQEIGFRSSSEGFDLLLRSDAELEDQSKLDLVVLDGNGVTEFVMDKDKARQAFDHPTVTPEVVETITPVDPWDEALDALNGLPIEDKMWAIRKVERIRKGGKIGAVLLLETVKSQATPAKGRLAAA